MNTVQILIALGGIVGAFGGLAGVGAVVKVVLDYRRARRLDPVPEEDVSEIVRLRRGSDDADKKREDLYKTIAALSGQVEKAMAVAEALKADVAELRKSLEETENECRELREKLDAERALRAAAERERESMRVKFVATLAERDALERDVAELKRARTEGTGRFRPQGGR